MDRIAKVKSLLLCIISDIVATVKLGISILQSQTKSLEKLKPCAPTIHARILLIILIPLRFTTFCYSKNLDFETSRHADSLL